MGGAGATATITPLRSGNIFCHVRGVIGPTSSGVGAGIGYEAELYFGSGSAPAFNAAVTGTQFGNLSYYQNGTSLTGTDGLFAFVLTGIATGLSIGTAYWFDIAQAFITGTGLELQVSEFELIEL
jgi:hypothetical protein